MCDVVLLPEVSAIVHGYSSRLCETHHAMLCKCTVPKQAAASRQAKELKSKYTGVSSDAMRSRSRTSGSGGLGSSSLSGSGCGRHAVHAGCQNW